MVEKHIDASLRQQNLVLTAMLAFGVIAWQHFFHTALIVRTDAGLGEHLPHVLRDGLLALPLASVAVIIGGSIAAGLTRRKQSPPRFVRVAITTEVFMLGMAAAIPIHGKIDGLLGGVNVVEGEIFSHVLRDTLIGQAAAFPLLFLGLHFFGRRASSHALSRGSLVRITVAGAMIASVLVIPNPIVRGDSVAAQPDVDGCEVGTPERSYDVSAISIDMILNQFGDHDPAAMMYVLDSRIADVRAQETSRVVSPGLRQDAMQALVIRANVGDCLVINFTNRMTSQPASFAVQGMAYTAANASGGVGTNPAKSADFLETINYRIPISSDPQAEGAYQIYTHYNMRQSLAHGLFGMLVVEPFGSEYMDPERDGQPLQSGWEAIIVDPFGVDFREFVIIMHEVGDETFEVLDVNDEEIPVIDDFGTYRPASRALNYRSEPFLNRLLLEEEKSLAYSSYAFGDPSTPIPRSYLGEPTKTRLSHPGSEMFHVYHLHGGGSRWRRQPGVEPDEFAQGLTKTPTADATSTRMDSQSAGPGETYNLEHECGAGGCQQSAGDFLFHCHIGQHYVAGMWSFWRVFDTIQSDLAVMPVDPGYIAPPIANQGSSLDLIGTVIEGKTLVPAVSVVHPDDLAIEDFIASLLPPPGVTLDAEDATVYDWIIEYVEGDLNKPRVLGEPDDTAVWANYASDTPGQRREIQFNLTNGRLAWPQFSPHLGKRPPFAPNGHSGAAWLGENGSLTRPDGLCPTETQMPGSRRLNYPVTAIDLPVEIAPGVIDPLGMFFVLSEDIDVVRAGTEPVEPLVLRWNVGDCMNIIFTSEQIDENHGDEAKANMHTHLVQFDPQSSDGVISGFSYEQSVRPVASENRTLVTAVTPGDTVVNVTNVDRLRVGIAIGVGLTEGMCDAATGIPVASPTNSDLPCTEIRTITEINGTIITLDAPLERVHAIGEAVGVEFVQYLWYTDVDSGTIFFHDHVDFRTWFHGLFGALIIEPAGSTYHNPETGAEVRSGAVVDIRTPHTATVGAGQQGSFRELVAMINNKHSGVDQTDVNEEVELSTINMKAAPLDDRSNKFPFSSVTNDDPMTPILRSYVGDDVVIRSLGVIEREGTIKVTGHRFKIERFADDAQSYDTAHLGISEREDLILEGGAGGPAGLPGDFLIYNSVDTDLQQGAWSIMRVHDTMQPDLQVLPGNVAPADLPGGFPQQTFTGGNPTPAAGPGNPCPASTPLRTHNVSIFDTAQAFGGVMYALSSDVAAILAGTKAPEPLVLRIGQGACLEINLTNNLLDRSSLALGKLLFDPQGSQGSAIGFNQDSTIAPGETRTYRYYADAEVGTSLFTDMATPDNTALGAFGAVIVEPAGATWRDSVTGLPIDSGVSADIVLPSGSFREHVILFQEQDARIGTDAMPYHDAVEGFAGINYTADPFRTLGLNGRLDINPDPGLVFDSDTHGDPNTLVRAYVGDDVRLRIGVGSGAQSHVFKMEGHLFPWEPNMANAEQLPARAVLPGATFDAHLTNGAGGGAPTGADYLLGDGRMPFFEAGAWGIFRTYSTLQTDLLQLPPDTGMLRVTASPAVPTQIIVDGIERDTWSLDWVRIPIGAHDVCFSHVAGFTAPSCETVLITADATTTVLGSFTPRGFLRVNTSPALPSTISVDGIPMDDWGIWTDIEPGTYEVCYGAVAGFDPPTCESAVVTAGATSSVTGVFAANAAALGQTGHGMIRATTSPAVPTQISIDGILRDTWSLEWVKVPPGPHEVCFGDIPGFSMSTCQNVVVAEGATTVVQGSATQRGFLKVDTAPARAATIIVNQIPRDAWGIWTDVAPGTYDVCFGPVAGFAPACQSVQVTAGATTALVGTWPP